VLRQAVLAARVVTPSTSSASMSEYTQTVDAYIAALDHPHHEAVQLLRAVILGADPEITETVK